MATTAGTLPQYATNTGMWAWITTVDHKRIGTLYLVTMSQLYAVAEGSGQ